MANSESAVNPASGDSVDPRLAEINSAPAEIRPLLTLLYDATATVEGIRAELSRVHQLNPTHLRDFVVPYSGMFLVFYVAQRLMRHSEDPSRVSAECIELFEALIVDFGANPNCTDGVMKQNVMFYAAKAGSLDCCRALVRLGSTAALADIHNQTPLFYAAREGRSEIVEWLVKEGGCAINHIDRNGQTALFYAAREDKLTCVMKMINELGADPLIRDVYKKRARAYLKAPTQKQTFDFLSEIERARDPSTHSSHRKLFLVRDEPLGAAAMKLRQHRPYNPYQEEDQLAPSPVSTAPPKRQRSSLSGASTPASSAAPKLPKAERTLSVASTPAPKPERAQSSETATPLPVNGRSKFRVKAPLGKGGLESFEKSFPEFALWMNGSPPPATATNATPPTPPKALTRPPRAPVAGLTPPWVAVVSLLLRGPLWRYGPATIFHKQALQMPANLGPKYQQTANPGEPEKKLAIDLSVIRKKLEKGKYLRLTEIDRDVRSMFSQAYSLVGGPESDLGVLTKATEMYYDQQLAGSGLASVIRQEAEEVARSARMSIISAGVESTGSNDVMIQ